MAEPQQAPAARPTRPFEVRVDGARHGSFQDLRDAIEAAQIVKRERPSALVVVQDAATGQAVVAPDA